MQFNIITINLILLILNLKSRIYATMLNFNRYLLANYMLLDNCRVLNLVNNKKLLVFSSFVKLTRDKYIKAKMSRILIISQGKHLLAKALKGLDDSKSANIILNNVVIIKDFYINIISKDKL